MEQNNKPENITRRNFKIKSIKICPIIGLGYWKDVYNPETGYVGYTHNFILICLRISFGYILKID